jgi:hypothetical protein
VSKKQQLEKAHNKNLSKRVELVLCNLQELYVAFNDKHSTVSAGFFKFAKLCPTTVDLQVQEESIQHVNVT